MIFHLKNDRMWAQYDDLAWRKHIGGWEDEGTIWLFAMGTLERETSRIWGGHQEHTPGSVRRWCEPTLSKNVKPFFVSSDVAKLQYPTMADDKKFFIMLSLLIPGPDAVTANHIDVFLGPLIHIWMEGIMCADVARSRGETRFRLRTMLLCCIHDFPEAHIRWAFMRQNMPALGRGLQTRQTPWCVAASSDYPHYSHCRIGRWNTLDAHGLDFVIVFSRFFLTWLWICGPRTCSWHMSWMWCI